MIPGAFVLLIVALAFIVAELFVTSHGVLAICAAVAAIGSVFMAYEASPPLAFVFSLVILVSTPFVFFYAIKIYPKTPVGRRVILGSPPAAGANSFAADSARLAELIGQRGIAVTTLRPAGSIEIAGRRLDAMSESEVIDAGSPVEVASVVGMKLLVKSVQAPA